MMVLAFSLTACGENNNTASQITDNLASNNSSSNIVSDADTNSNTNSSTNGSDENVAELSNVTIQFGEGGELYTIIMEDNDTARELVRNITDAGRNLPIYDYDNFEGYEYFQYYDIPTRYDIPSNPVELTSVKAGEVYYSDPNRVILFYQDAEISGEYTKVGQIEDVTGLKEAVENNPVLEGWGNKLILLKYAN